MNFLARFLMIFDFSFAEKPQHVHFFWRFLACSARGFLEVDVNVHFDWTLTSNESGADAYGGPLIIDGTIPAI